MTGRRSNQLNYVPTTALADAVSNSIHELPAAGKPPVHASEDPDPGDDDGPVSDPEPLELDALPSLPELEEDVSDELLDSPLDSPEVLALSERGEL